MLIQWRWGQFRNAFIVIVRSFCRPFFVLFEFLIHLKNILVFLYLIFLFFYPLLLYFWCNPYHVLLSFCHFYRTQMNSSHAPNLNSLRCFRNGVFWHRLPLVLRQKAPKLPRHNEILRVFLSVLCVESIARTSEPAWRPHWSRVNRALKPKHRS